MRLWLTGTPATMVLCCAMGLFAAASATQADDAAKGATAPLAQQREAAKQRLNQEEQACGGQFLHNECVQRARERHRPALEALHMLELEQRASRRKAQAEARERSLSTRTPPEPRSAGSRPVPASAPIRRDEQARERAQAASERQQNRARVLAEHAAKEQEAPARQQAFLEKQRQADEKRRAKAARPETDKKAQPLSVTP